MPVRKVIHHAHKIKHKARKHLRMYESHNFLCDKIPLYKWWHEQDIHRHVHYIGIFAGLIMAVYYVMLDGIFSQVDITTAAEVINLITLF